MAEDQKKYHIMCDGDLGPYIRGENPELDKIVDELAEKMLEDVRNGKFDKKEDTDTSEN